MIRVLASLGRWFKPRGLVAPACEEIPTTPAADPVAEARAAGVAAERVRLRELDELAPFLGERFAGLLYVARYVVPLTGGEVAMEALFVRKQDLELAADELAAARARGPTRRK